MGVSMEDINKGLLNVGQVLANSMEMWDRVSGRPPEDRTPTLAQTSAPAVPQGAQPQGTSATAEAFAFSTPMLLMGAAVVFLLVWDRRR